jgi:hypothetical protein
MVFVGEFEVDPESIPEAPDLPEKQSIVLEVATAERKEKIDDNGRKSVRISARFVSVDLLGAPSAFATLWVTEQYRGKPHRSFAQFLRTTGLPYTTQASDLKGLRVVGQVARNKTNSEFYDVVEVNAKA